MRQLGEGRVARHIALGVQHAPGEQRHRIARLDHRPHLREVGGGGLVVDRRLPAFQRQAAFAPAAHPEDMAHIQPEHDEGQHRHEIERGRALAGIDQLLAAHLAEFGGVGDVEARRQIDHAAGRRDQHGRHLGVVVAHPRIAQQEGELRGARGADEGRAVVPRPQEEVIGAGDGPAARGVADHHIRPPRQVARQIGRHEAGPDIAAAAFGEGDIPFDGAAGEIHGTLGCGRRCAEGCGTQTRRPAQQGPAAEKPADGVVVHSSPP